MDSFPSNTVANEQLFFLSKLKSNPFFLCKNLPSLCQMLWDRQRCQYLTKWRGKHRSHKSRPSWLKNMRLDAMPFLPDHKKCLHRIPVRKINLNTHCSLIPPETVKSSPAMDDPEDYFALHRWGHLLQDFYWNDDKNPSSFNAFSSVSTWLLHMPAKNDSAWEPYSVSERIANLLTYLTFVPLESRPKLIASDTLADFLFDSIKWIDNHLEYYGNRTNNHILNNARALIMGGAILNHSRSVEIGLKILDNMLPVLLEPNGSLRERSSHYHLIVLTWLLDAYTFAKIHTAIPAASLCSLHDAINRMRHVASIFCDENGFLEALVGDVSPDAAPAITAARLRICYPNVWPPSVPKKRFQIQHDSWHIIKNSSQKVLLNCPDGLFPKKYPTHGHNDFLSFTWLYQNKLMLIDTGRHRYTKDPISIHQKSALGHNLPLVNNFAPLCESLVINGNWMPTPYAKAEITIDRDSAEGIYISHNGFARATPVKQHDRRITLLSEGITIRDDFIGSGVVDIKLIFNLSSDFLDFNPQTLTFSHQTFGQVSLQFEQTSDFNHMSYYASSDKKSFFSTAYGVAISYPVLVLSGRVQLPFKVTTQFKVISCVA